MAAIGYLFFVGGFVFTEPLISQGYCLQVSF